MPILGPASTLTESPSRNGLIGYGRHPWSLIPGSALSYCGIEETNLVRGFANSPTQTGVTVFQYVSVPILVTAFAWITGTDNVNPLQAVLSLLLLQIAWSSWQYWRSRPISARDFPTFTLVAVMIWLAYGLPLFCSQEQSWSFAGGFASPDGIVRAQLLALLGIVSLYFGMRLGVGRRLRTTPTLDLRDTSASPKYVIAAMVFGVSLRYLPILSNFLGSSFRQVFMILQNALPLVAYAILLRRSLMRRVPLYERALLVSFVLGTVLFGLATGWVGTGVSIIMVTGCVVLDTRFTIPKAAVLVVFSYILFLQPAKQQFRAAYWGTDSQSGDVSRASDWISMSKQKWQHALSDSDPEALRQQLYGSMSRFSMLQQSSNVMDLTPSIVPYQGWKMYSFMAYTLIPRAIWKDKPMVNDANRFYQVTYKITAERDLDGVSIGVGVLTEGYISFGWIGAAFAMAFVGVVLDCVTALTLTRDAGMLMKGVGIALLPGFAVMEAHMAQYLGGVVQQAFLTILIMLPLAQVTRRWQIQPSFRRRRVPVPPQPVRIPGASHVPEPMR